jgi:hypothetical protein
MITMIITINGEPRPTFMYDHCVSGFHFPYHSIIRLIGFMCHDSEIRQLNNKIETQSNTKYKEKAFGRSFGLHVRTRTVGRLAR